MMRMSKGFKILWQEHRLDELLSSIALQPSLRALVEAPLIEKAGGLLLEPLAEHVTGPAAFQDRTEYEAFVNKFHVDDFMENTGATDRDRLGLLVQQGAKAALMLSERLVYKGSYRVLLCLDEQEPTMTLRFFAHRPGEIWGGDDPDAFPLEEMLIIDVPRHPSVPT
jgi:hypothetical protein